MDRVLNISVSKYVKVLDILGYIRGSLRKRCVIYAWQDSEYFSGFEYRVTRVTQGSSENAAPYTAQKMKFSIKDFFSK